jgi:hypothetical protein
VRRYAILIVLLLCQVCAVCCWMGNDTTSKIDNMLRQSRIARVCDAVLEAAGCMDHQPGATVDVVSVATCGAYEYYIVDAATLSKGRVTFGVMVPTRPTLDCVIVAMDKEARK